jgi:hypothetical protein
VSKSIFNVIQSLLWPEIGIFSEIELFMRPKGPVVLSYTERRVSFESGGQLNFDTAGNLLNLTKWKLSCCRFRGRRVKLA